MVPKTNALSIRPQGHWRKIRAAQRRICTAPTSRRTKRIRKARSSNSSMRAARVFKASLGAYQLSYSGLYFRLSRRRPECTSRRGDLTQKMLVVGLEPTISCFQWMFFGRPEPLGKPTMVGGIPLDSDAQRTRQRFNSERREASPTKRQFRSFPRRPQWGSNPRPYAYEAHGLPIEL